MDVCINKHINGEQILHVSALIADYDKPKITAFVKTYNMVKYIPIDFMPEKIPDGQLPCLTCDTVKYKIQKGTQNVDISNGMVESFS